jgi:hypothetical protein
VTLPIACRSRSVALYNDLHSVTFDPVGHGLWGGGGGGVGPNFYPYTVRSQADICENILFHNLTVCVDTYICDLSFPKIAVLKVL